MLAEHHLLPDAEHAGEWLPYLRPSRVSCERERKAAGALNATCRAPTRKETPPDAKRRRRRLPAAACTKAEPCRQGRIPGWRLPVSAYEFPEGQSNLRHRVDSSGGDELQSVSLAR